MEDRGEWDNMRDGTDGDTDGTRWLSYAELAETRGISKRSAIRLTFRHRWPRQKGNDGTVRVSVPLSELDGRQDEKSATDDAVGGDIRGDIHDKSSAIIALEAAIMELRSRAEQDRAEITRERTRADRAEAELGTMREKIAELREARSAAEAKTEAAEARVDDLTVQVVKLTQAQAKAEFLQAEVDRSRAEADRLRQEAAAAEAKPRRRWLPWHRRHG